MNTTPTRPDTKPTVDEETDQALRECDATFEQDKKTSFPWVEVKARLLEQRKPR